MTIRLWTNGFDTYVAESPADTRARPRCFGCECGVPLVGDMHHEETDIPGTVYEYPCTDQGEQDGSAA